MTGETEFPESVRGSLRDGSLEYFCNTDVSYALRGVHVTLNVLWDFEQPMSEGDRHYAYYRGTKSRIEVRQTKEQNFKPELYVVPNAPARRGELKAALLKRVGELEKSHAGIALRDAGADFRWRSRTRTVTGTRRISRRSSSASWGTFGIRGRCRLGRSQTC